MTSERIEEKLLAEESEKTKKLREKLNRHLISIEEKVTQQALDRKINEIHHWISRHASHRIPLKSKAISLFDENQNTAKVSQKVINLVKKLDSQFSSFQVQEKGRITLIEKE